MMMTTMTKMMMKVIFELSLLFIWCLNYWWKLIMFFSQKKSKGERVRRENEKQMMKTRMTMMMRRMIKSRRTTLLPTLPSLSFSTTWLSHQPCYPSTPSFYPSAKLPVGARLYRTGGAVHMEPTS